MVERESIARKEEHEEAAEFRPDIAENIMDRNLR
jgi:hypothetical protein